MKNYRINKLNNKECPDCGASTKIFFDQNTNTKFTQEVISTRVLQRHSCSNIYDIEYKCKICGLKEVYPQ